MDQFIKLDLGLRSDGALVVKTADQQLEVALTPAHLLQLGIDCLRTATRLDNRLMPEAAEALANTIVQSPRQAGAALN